MNISTNEIMGSNKVISRLKPAPAMLPLLYVPYPLPGSIKKYMKRNYMDMTKKGITKVPRSPKG